MKRTMFRDPELQVSEVKFIEAPKGATSSGLLGFVMCTINRGLRVEGLALRRTRRGRLTLSYPERRDRLGLLHEIVRPVDEAARRAIEAQVFAALNLQEAGR